MRDADKRTKHMASEPGIYQFVPLSVESYGRLGEPALQFLGELADSACSSGLVDRGLFVANAKKELGVALCRGNALLFQDCYGNLAKASGAAWSPGLERPVSDVI